MPRKLDRFDIALLNLLQANNIATAEELAREVALSPSAITRRIRRLRDDGCIAADTAILAAALTEGRLRAVIHVQANEHAEEKGLAHLRARLAATEEVQLLLDVSGSFDLLVLAVTRDMAAFNAFTDAYLACDPAVRRYETSFVKKEVKNAPRIRLDERDAEP